MRHTNETHSGRTRTALAAIATLATLAAPVHAATSRVTQPLASTAAAPGARGRARVVLRGTSDGTFLVEGHGLARRATFEVVVNAVRVGALATNGHGSGKSRFRTRPRHDDQILGFEPRGAEVEVRNGAGEDVLHGTIPGTPPSPGTIVCCVPDHGGDGPSECEDRTADACSAAGGTVTQATSCLPNPCATTPPDEKKVVCCDAGSSRGAFLRHDDDPGDGDHGAECEERTAAECAERGGTAVTATSCTPNPCSPTPPPPPASEVTCCLPGYYTAGACAVLTGDQCAAQNGTVSTATTCEPNPCTTAPGGHHGHHGNDG